MPMSVDAKGEIVVRIPSRAARPYEPLRKTLYSVDELMSGWDTEKKSVDERIADYYKRQGCQVPKEPEEALCQRIHDDPRVSAESLVERSRAFFASFERAKRIRFLTVGWADDIRRSFPAQAATSPAPLTYFPSRTTRVCRTFQAKNGLAPGTIREASPHIFGSGMSAVCELDLSHRPISISPEACLLAANLFEPPSLGRTGCSRIPGRSGGVRHTESARRHAARHWEGPLRRRSRHCRL